MGSSPLSCFSSSVVCSEERTLPLFSPSFN
jgi:hypothetical protein